MIAAEEQRSPRDLKRASHCLELPGCLSRVQEFDGARAMNLLARDLIIFSSFND
jgi:hypothetical protein